MAMNKRLICDQKHSKQEPRNIPLPAVLRCPISCTQKLIQHTPTTFSRNPLARTRISSSKHHNCELSHLATVLHQ